MTCARIADLDFVERYVLGQMDEAEQASFEAHYFECPDCFAAVQALQAAQTVLRANPSDTAAGLGTVGAGTVSQPGAPPEPAASSRVVDFGAHTARAKAGDGAAPTSAPVRSRQSMSSATWIGLAAAASLAGLLVWAPWRAKTPDAGTGPGAGPSTEPVTTVAKQTPPKPAGTLATGQPTTGQPSTGQPSSGQPSTGQSGSGQTASATTGQPSGAGSGSAPGTRPNANPGSIRNLITLETLALVTPPPYVPLQSRGNESGSGDAFAAAMTKYAAKDYRGAVDGLKAVVETQPDAVHAQFFLGISYLALDEPAAASAVLNRVAGSNAAPFADEAHFYLAKAAIRAHDLDRAERELSLAIERQAGPPNEAQKLSQALRLYRRDHGQDE